MIVYEYPLNERIRTWLRLEDLFGKAGFFVRAGDSRSHHAGLLALFELADVMARPELRSELIQELERQKLSLEPLRGNPAVDPDRLEPLLERLASALATLHGLSGKLGQHIRENDWLAGIKSRTGIPGGACGFDLPGYYYWLNQPAAVRVADLERWLAPLQPIRSGVELILELLRESGNQGHYSAVNGTFQLMLGGRVVQMLRVGLDERWPCVPEVSANKYAVNLRFVTVEKNQKPKTYEQDVTFELVFCSLIGCCVQPI
ncbi:cell division protein ZapD [Parasulfuritortus cantonensis]|uniref:Cell division protein ZapD n=1 Tax=Parasulfuritortus cantonensis TaxID=2528202 RepID=A0A4R1BGL0_9PROT|nr:cell division protein ZapD [Parasulfuritortus cantonensis]TCJ16333.1 cell division protein ZapD [Parasulfuritortus cantonensis]